MRSGHTTKIGAQLRRNNFDIYNPGDAFTGVYNFTGEITSPNRSANNPVQAMADFLLGQVKTSFYELPQPRTVRQNHNLGLFVQDDWKVNPKLTVNLGLRYEYESPMTIDNDVYSRMDIRSGAGLGQLLVANNNASDTTDLDGDGINLAPRVGVAYALNDKTVLRSAFGLFYGQIFSNLGGVVTYPGFTVRQEFNNLGAGVAQPFLLNEGMPLTAVQNLDDPFFVERSATPARPLSVQGSGNNQFGTVSPLPYSVQWNFGVQHEVMAGTILDVSYIGSRGVNLPPEPPVQLGPLRARRGSRPRRLVPGKPAVAPFPQRQQPRIIRACRNLELPFTAAQGRAPVLEAGLISLHLHLVEVAGRWQRHLQFFAAERSGHRPVSQ